MWNPDENGKTKVNRGGEALKKPIQLKILSTEQVFTKYLMESDLVRTNHGLGRDKQTKKIFIKDLEKFCSLSETTQKLIERIIVAQL